MSKKSKKRRKLTESDFERGYVAHMLKHAEGFLKGMDKFWPTGVRTTVKQFFLPVFIDRSRQRFHRVISALKVLRKRYEDALDDAQREVIIEEQEALRLAWKEADELEFRMFVQSASDEAIKAKFEEYGIRERLQ